MINILDKKTFCHFWSFIDCTVHSTTFNVSESRYCLQHTVKVDESKLADIAQSTGCAIVMIGHLNKASGTQSTYRGLGSIDIAAVVRSILFVGKVKDDPTTRVIVHEKSSLAPPGQALAFSLGDQKGFRWIGAYEISAEDLLAGGEGTKAELKQEQAVKLIYEFLSDGREVSVLLLLREIIYP